MISSLVAHLPGHLLESTAFVALMALLTLCFSNNRAAVRYGLWFAASIKFLIPFSLLAAAGGALRWESAPAVKVPRLMTEAVPVLSLPDIALPAPSSPALSFPDHGLSSGAALPDAAFAPLNALPAASGWDLESLLLAVWLAGSVLLLGRWTVQWLRLRAVRRASTPAPFAAAIPVRFSRMLFEPGLVGIFRPILLLPEGITAQLSPAQLALVIEHELCHWRRRDNLTAALHMAAQLVFWFHPLLWWIGKRLVAERERAVDESVLTACSDPKAYADSILEVCRFYIRSPLACAPGVAGANLTHRVERIMANVAGLRLSFPKMALLSLVAAGALLLPMAAGLLTSSAAAEPPSAPKSTALPLPVKKAISAAPARAPQAPAIRRGVSAPAPPPRLVTPRLVTLASLTNTPAPMPAQTLPTLALRPEEPAEETVVAANTIPASDASARPVTPPTAPLEEIVVTAKRIREFVRTRNFVRNYTAPSDFLDQISRWHEPLCVHVEGLAPAFNAFVGKRVRSLAAEVGAPKAKDEPCKINLDVVFSDHPQEMLDYISKKRPELLGPHYPALRKKLATVSHPVQAWYATATRDFRGRQEVDSYDDWWGGLDVDGTGAPVYVVPGSHLRSGLTSEFAAVTIVADKAKVQDWEIGTISDYIAMMALARAKTPDKCQQVPSITNVLENCSDGVRATSLSPFDMAYLKALYMTVGDEPRNLQESGISRAMIKILEKQIEGKK